MNLLEPAADYNRQHSRKSDMKSQQASPDIPTCFYTYF